MLHDVSQRIVGIRSARAAIVDYHAPEIIRPHRELVAELQTGHARGPVIDRYSLSLQSEIQTQRLQLDRAIQIDIVRIVRPPKWQHQK